MKFFFDNCISPKLARALHILSPDHEIRHLRDKFPEAAKDVDWIVKLGEEKEWVIFSLDKLWRVPQQRQALIEARVVCFFFMPGWNQEIWVQSSRLFALWPTFTKTAGESNQGDCYRVPFKGQQFDKFKL